MIKNMKSQKDKTLLIVEDFDIIRNLIGKEFQRNGFTIISVGRVTDAVLVGETNPPDVIIVDYDMRSSDPYQAISILHQTLPGSAVFLMNGSRNRCVEEKARLAGAQNILERIFQLPVLERIIYGTAV
jgi:DNA-binding NtrC family response regulator